MLLGYSRGIHFIDWILHWLLGHKLSYKKVTLCENEGIDSAAFFGAERLIGS